MATVEAAIAVGALVLVFAVVLGGLGAVVARIRCVDAAAEAARRAARDDLAGARGVVGDLPTGAEVEVALDADLVRVRVHVPPLGGALRVLPISADAVAAREPTVAAPLGSAADDGAVDLGGSDPADPAGVDAPPESPGSPESPP